VKYREVYQIVERDGWVQVRQTGSHRQYKHPTKPGTVTIHGHPAEEIHPKTLRSVLRQAQIERPR
jgi:predicted RNA binding protein YcfA (HicA-like mRNA interferase family)